MIDLQSQTKYSLYEWLSCESVHPPSIAVAAVPIRPQDLHLHPPPQTTPPRATSRLLSDRAIENHYTTIIANNRQRCSPNTSRPSPRPSRPSTPNPARRRATSSPCCRPMRAPPWRSTSRSSARRRNHCPLRWRSSSVRARLYCKTTQSTSTDCMTFTEDGKEMSIDLEKMKIRDIQTEVDRHSRQLLRQEELNG